MPTDPLVHGVIRSLAEKWDECIPLFCERKYHRPAPSQYWKMIENVNVYLYFLKKVRNIFRVKMDFVWLCWIATRCCCYPCLSGYTHVMRIYEAPFSRVYCLIKVPSYWDVFQGSCFNINILLLQVEHFLRYCPQVDTARPHWLLLNIGQLKVMAKKHKKR